MEEKTLTDKALEALKGLGKSGKQVAESLKKKRIKGTGGAEYCPLAEFLRKKFKNTVPQVYGDGSFSIKHHERPNLPYGCKVFVDQFDDGKYPELQRNQK